MSDAPPPLLVEFDGAVFRPSNPRMRERIAQYFELGATYRVEFKDHRSAESHNATFAGIARAWDNLTVEDSRRFPTAMHFRKWLLVQNGFADSREVVCDTADDAMRFAVVARSLDSYAVITVRSNVVTIYTAQSMAAKTMDRKTFETAKQLILQQAAEMVGIDVPTLTSKPQDAPDHNHPNAPDLTSDQPAENLRAPQADTPRPPIAPGGSTPATAAQPMTDGVADQPGRPEQTEQGRGDIFPGDLPPSPRTYDQYVIWLNTWLSFIKHHGRIMERFDREKTELWPKIKPAITVGQAETLQQIVLDAIAGN